MQVDPQNQVLFHFEVIRLAKCLPNGEKIRDSYDEAARLTLPGFGVLGDFFASGRMGNDMGSSRPGFHQAGKRKIRKSDGLSSDFQASYKIARLALSAAGS